MSADKNRDDKYRHISQMEDSEAAEFGMAEIKKAIANKSNDFVRNERYLRLYKALDQAEDIIDETTGKISDDAAIYSNTHLPIGAWLVDTATVQIYNQIFPTPDYFDLDADDWWDDLKAHRVKAHIMKRHREMRFRTNMYRLVQAAMTFDYAVWYDTWKVRWGNKPTLVQGTKYMDVGGIKLPYKEKRVEMREGIVESRSDMHIVDFFQCAHDYNAGPDIRDSWMFCDWRMVQFWELLKENEAVNPIGVYKNLDKVYASVAKGLGISLDTPQVDPRDRARMENQRIRVYRLWTNDETFEIAYGAVIRRQKADGIPLSKLTAYELPGEFKGMGILQRVERMCYDINAIINQKRDFGNLVNNPIAVLSSDIEGVEEGDTSLFPGKTLVTGGSADKKIAFYQPSANFANGSTEELAMQIGMTKETAGFSENSGGSFSQTVRSAREISAVAAGLLTKVSAIASRFEEDAIAPSLMRQFKLEQMYLTGEDSFKYNGPGGADFLIIRPEDYAWGKAPRFQMKGSTHVQYRDIYVQQFFKAMAVSMQLGPELMNKPNVMAKMWQLMDPNDYMNFIKDPREPEHNVPPNMENMLIADGHHVEISPANNHDQHIQVHETIKYTPDYQAWPEVFRQELDRHIQEHKNASMGALMQRGAAQGGAGAQSPMAMPMPQDESDMMRGVRGGNLSVQ